MKTSWIILGVAALAAMPAAADTLVVPGLTLTGFSFEVAAASGATSAMVTEATAGSAIASTAGADLAGGALSGNPLFSFQLTDPVGRLTGQGLVTMALAGVAAPATVDTAANTLTLDLSTLTFAWDTGPAPSLCTVKACIQPQASGPVSGPWNPVTGQFTMSWSYYWFGDTVGDDHPFPLGTSTLSLSGMTAQPIPEPGTLALWLGALLIGTAWQGVARRRANGEPKPH